MLLVLLVLLKTGDYWLGIYELVYSNRGAIYGAGYTDLVVQANANRLLVVLSLLVAAGLVVNLFRRGTLWIVAGLVGLIGVSLVVGSVVPGLVQEFAVEPNELVRERPYIERHIQMTRQAFGLDWIDERVFEACAAGWTPTPWPATGASWRTSASGTGGPFCRPTNSSRPSGSTTPSPTCTWTATGSTAATSR